MKKIIVLALMILSVSAYANTGKKTGCVLAQQGDVKVQLDNKEVASKVEYTPVAKEGKNFRSILVGSSMKFSTEDDKKMQMLIVDIKADPKVKDKPRTGVVTLDVKIDDSVKSVPMRYSFSEGLFSAEGMIDGSSIKFSTKIEAILCYAKPLK